MTKKTDANRACQICGSKILQDLRPASMVRPGIVDLIRRDKGEWDEHGCICSNDLDKYRNIYIEKLLKDEKGKLSETEQEVLNSMKEQEILSKNPDVDFEEKLTFGERLADRIADFGGSWLFICIFVLMIIVWMFINTYVLIVHPFDPYPYILLNLVLSCLAALQAPVIMMSQNRQESRDRERALHDYQVNLKAELEIRHLHQKLDHLMSHQWQRLVEIQEVQMNLMNELLGKQDK